MSSDLTFLLVMAICLCYVIIMTICATDLKWSEYRAAIWPIVLVLTILKVLLRVGEAIVDEVRGLGKP